MFYIVNIEARAILCYRGGTRMVYRSLDQANNHPILSQELSGHPHTVLHITDTVTWSLNRTLAPWISRR